MGMVKSISFGALGEKPANKPRKKTKIKSKGRIPRMVIPNKIRRRK